MRLRLTADPSGNLASIQVGERSFQDFGELHKYVVDYVNTDSATQEEGEVEIRCDYNLRYEFVIGALTAVRGYRKVDGGIKDLITKIKFAPPEEDPEG